MRTQDNLATCKRCHNGFYATWSESDYCDKCVKLNSEDSDRITKNIKKAQAQTDAQKKD